MKPSHLLNELSLQHLRVLDVLLETQRVTATAARLGVTQSAVSHALRHLREVIGDELLVRSGGTMLLTPRAEALRQPLRHALNALGSALEVPERFDPATATGTYILAMGDAFALTMLPRILQMVRAEAPGINLSVVPDVPGRAGAAVEVGDAALEITAAQPTTPLLRSRKLGSTSFVCAVRPDHPRVGETLDLDTFCALPHALPSPTGRGNGVVDDALSELGRSRRIQLRIRYFMAAPLLVAGTDLILTGPRMLLETLAELVPLRLLEPPLVLPEVSLWLSWHPTMQDDPGHRWLRDVCVRAGSAGV